MKLCTSSIIWWCVPGWRASVCVCTGKNACMHYTYRTIFYSSSRTPHEKWLFVPCRDTNREGERGRDGRCLRNPSLVIGANLKKVWGANTVYNSICGPNRPKTVHIWCASTQKHASSSRTQNFWKLNLQVFSANFTPDCSPPSYLLNACQAAILTMKSQLWFLLRQRLQRKMMRVWRQVQPSIRATNKSQIRKTTYSTMHSGTETSNLVRQRSSWIRTKINGSCS